MGASLLSPSLTLLWAGLLGLGLLGGAGLPSHSHSERSVQLPAQGLICCSCGKKKRCVLHGPEVRSCSHVGVSFLFVSFPLEKRRAVLHGGSAGPASLPAQCDGLCVAAVVDIVSRSAVDSMLSQKEAGTLRSRDCPSPEVLPTFL